MFNVDQYNIPPAIKDMISKLRDESIPYHIRNNYKLMLENISQACSIEIERFIKTPLVPRNTVRKKRAK